MIRQSRLLAQAFALSLLIAGQSAIAVAAGISSHAEIKSRVEVHALRGMVAGRDLTDIQAFIAKHPDDPEARFIAGEALNARGFQYLAIEQFDASCKSDPQYFLNRFHALLQRGSEYAYPIAFYAIQHYPKDSGVLYVQARHAMEMGRKTTAANYLDEALHSKPIWPATYRDLAKFLLKEKRTHESFKYSQLALKANPNDYVANWVNVVALCRLTGHPELYTERLQKLADESPGNDDVAFALAKGYLANHQYEQAVVPVLSAIKYGGTQTGEQSEELLKSLMHVVPKTTIVGALERISPPNSRDLMSTIVWMRVARILSETGAHHESIKMLLQALQMGAFFAPEINYRLGEEWEALNDDRNAMLFYRTAYEFSPEGQKFERAYTRAVSRSKNKNNDLARRIKSVINPRCRN